MLKISGLVALTLTAGLAFGPAVAAPAFSGTNTAPGEGGDFTVDCSDMQYRYLPYCQSNTQVLHNPAPSTLTSKRTNELRCPPGDMIFVGTNRSGERLYRCSTSRSDRVLKFGY